MTAPRDPGDNPPVDPAAEPRRGRHAAPDEPEQALPDDAADTALPGDGESAALDPAPAGAPESSDSGFAGALPDDDPLLARAASSGSDETAEASAPAASSTPTVHADGSTPRRRHAAEGSGIRLPGWMYALIGALVVGLLAWLIIGLAGDDEDEDNGATSTSASAGSATSAAPTPVDPAALPEVICTGMSYAMVDTGKTTEQLLADPGAAEAQFPGSQLSTIPPGCVANSNARDEVVLALGPFNTFEEACAAGKALQGVTFKAYAGNASTGLTETSCP